MKIVGTGFTCLDHINYMNEKYFSSGGTCTNVLVILAAFGLNSYLCMPHYRDELCDSFIFDVNRKGVSNIFYTKSNKSFPRIYQYMKNGEHYFKTKCEFCKKSLTQIESLSEKKAMEIIDNIKDADFFYCDRYSKGIKLLTEEAKKHNIWTMYEPNNCRFYKRQLEAMRMYDIVKFSTGRINETISEKIKGDLEESLVKILIVTRGEKGVQYVVRTKSGKFTEWKYIEGNILDSKLDSSGAGDWFSATLIYNLLRVYRKSNDFFENEIIEDLIDKARIVSGLSCNFTGAQGLLYDKEAFQDILDILGIKQSANHLVRLEDRKDYRCPNCSKIFSQ